jgi:Tol biopolymer transport system component
VHFTLGVGMIGGIRRSQWLWCLVAAVMLASTGCATLVEVSSGGTDHPTGQAFLQYSPSAPAVSGDGRYSVFVGPRSETDPTSEVYRHDAQTGDTVRVSSDAHGDPVGARGPAISRDGRYVAFITAATLVAGDVNLDPSRGWTGDDVYVRDMDTGARSLVSLDPTGGPLATGGPESFESSLMMSADARYVAFWTTSFQGRTYSASIYVRDRSAGASTLVGGGYASLAGLSGDGLHVAIDDHTACLTICPVYNGSRVLDWQASTSFDIGCESGGLMPMSTDGRYVVVTQTAKNGCLGGVVRYDRLDPTHPLGLPGSVGATDLTASADGSRVAFSAQTGLLGSDTNGVADVYVGDFADGVVQIASRGQFDAAADGPSVGPGLSGDGRYVVFSTGATNLLANDTDGQPDVVLVNALRPEISSVVPVNVARGAQNEVITLTGSGFDPGADVVVLGDGVTVGTPTVVNGRLALFRITVAANATPGPRDVLVITLGHWGNATGWCYGCLTVT